MKKKALKKLGIITLVGIGIGLILCLFDGELSVKTILIGIYIAWFFVFIAHSNLDDYDGVSSPDVNSAVYRTDIATGKIITELQKLNEEKNKKE